MRARKFTPNAYRIEGSSAYLALTNSQGQVVCEAIIDLADLDLALEFGRWHLSNGYVKNVRAGRFTPLHRLVIPVRSDQVVDHINHNRLDCRRANLRACTHAENLQNRHGPRPGARSGVRGVSWNPRGQSWQVTVRVATVRHYIGTFRTVEEAERAAIDARARLMTHAVD